MRSQHTWEKRGTCTATEGAACSQGQEEGAGPRTQELLEAWALARPEGHSDKRHSSAPAGFEWKKGLYSKGNARLNKIKQILNFVLFCFYSMLTWDKFGCGCCHLHSTY